jgi:hypothetical protein
MAQTEEQVTREDPRAWNDNRKRKPGAPVKATVAPKVLSSVEKYREARPSKKVVVGLMLAAAVVTMIIGFNWGGWVTGGSSLKAGVAVGEDAVLQRLVPICVAQFNQDPQSATKLDELKAITSSWDRPNYVKAQGWATMPGEAEPDSDVASACAKLLIGS